MFAFLNKRRRRKSLTPAPAIVDLSGIDRVTPAELFAAFRHGRDQNSELYRALIEVLRSAHADETLAAVEADNADDRATACGAIGALADLLADIDHFANTDPSQVEAAVAHYEARRQG